MSLGSDDVLRTEVAQFLDLRGIKCGFWNRVHEFTPKEHDYLRGLCPRRESGPVQDCIRSSRDFQSISALVNLYMHITNLWRCYFESLSQVSTAESTADNSDQNQC